MKFMVQKQMTCRQADKAAVQVICMISDKAKDYGLMCKTLLSMFRQDRRMEPYQRNVKYGIFGGDTFWEGWIYSDRKHPQGLTWIK